MRRKPARRRATTGEIRAVAFLLLYSVVAVGWAAAGTSFLLVLAVLGALVFLALRLGDRMRRRRLARVRRERRDARIASHRALWEEP